MAIQEPEAGGLAKALKVAVAANVGMNVYDGSLFALLLYDVSRRVHLFGLIQRCQQSWHCFCYVYRQRVHLLQYRRRCRLGGVGMRSCCVVDSMPRTCRTCRKTLA